MIRRAALALLTLLLVSCATPPPPAPSFTLAKNSKVGVLVALNSTAVHEHVGTTVFNNFSTERQLTWDLPKRASNAFSSGLTANGFDVVELGAQGFTKNEVDDLVVASGTSWQPNPVRSATLSRLKDELGLSAVVVVYDVRTLADLECGGGPCAERYVRTSGLFTRSFFGLTRYFAVAAIDAKVFVLQPAAELSAFDPIAKVRTNRVKLLTDMREPRDFKRLSDDEFQPVADWIGAYVDQIATASASALRAAGP